MTAIRCLGCGATIHDATLCSSCVGALERVLAEMPAQLADLDITVTKQSVMSGKGGGKPTKKSEYALPYNVHAADVAADVADKLGGWVLHFCEDEARSSGAADDARWLLAHLADIQRDEYAGDLLKEAAGWARRIDRAVDRPADRIFAGPCLAETPTDDDSNCQCRCHGYGGTHRPYCNARFGDSGCGSQHVQECDADLYVATMDAKTADCPACGTTHDLAERRTWLIVQAYDRIETAKTIAQALTGFLEGVTVSESSVRQMAHRNQISNRAPVGAQPRYKVGDVVEVLKARAERDQKKRAS